MNKLKQLISKCKCGVFLSVNEHRDYYQTAKQSLEEKDGHECLPEIAPEIRSAMIDTDTIIYLQFYPRTPVGSYSIYHHDLESALNEALDVLSS